jgi:hypothetical protein
MDDVGDQAVDVAVGVMCILLQRPKRSTRDTIRGRQGEVHPLLDCSQLGGGGLEAGW